MNETQMKLNAAYRNSTRKKVPTPPARDIQWQLQMLLDEAQKARLLEASEVTKLVLRFALNPFRSQTRGPNDILVILSREPDEDNEGEINPLVYAVRMADDETYEDEDDIPYSQYSTLRSAFAMALRNENKRRESNDTESR